MSHSPSNGNPFSLVWSISLPREAYRHTELNLWLSFSEERTSGQRSRWKDWNDQQKKVFGHFESWKWKKKVDVFTVDCIFFSSVFSQESTNNRILVQSVVSTEPWMIENEMKLASLKELSDLSEKSHESSRIWCKMQIHGSLIFTYIWSQRGLDFEAGLLV